MLGMGRVVDARDGEGCCCSLSTVNALLARRGLPALSQREAR